MLLSTYRKHALNADDEHFRRKLLITITKTIAYSVKLIYAFTSNNVTCK